MRASVISGRDASPVLDPAEDVLDLVALALEVFVVMVLDLAVFARRDARGSALRDQRGPEPVAVIALVAQQFLGAWQGIEQQNSALVVAHLALGEHHHDGAAFTVADCMQL